jgi:hypothetical protein
MTICKCAREGCEQYAMICLNGREWLCWDHYCETMRAEAASSRDPHGKET